MLEEKLTEILRDCIECPHRGYCVYDRCILEVCGAKVDRVSREQADRDRTHTGRVLSEGRMYT